MYGHKQLILSHKDHGNTEVGASMLSFCEKMNIEEEYHQMVDLANGDIEEHKGWTLIQKGENPVSNYANKLLEIGLERRANGLTMFEPTS